MTIIKYGLLHIPSGKIVQTSYGLNWITTYFIAIERHMDGTSPYQPGWESTLVLLEKDLGYSLYLHSPLEFEIIELPERENK